MKTLAREGPRADVTYGFAPLGSTLTFAGITVVAFEGPAPIVVPVCDAPASLDAHVDGGGSIEPCEWDGGCDDISSETSSPPPSPTRC